MSAKGVSIRTGIKHKTNTFTKKKWQDVDSKKQLDRNFNPHPDVPASSMPEEASPNGEPGEQRDCGQNNWTGPIRNQSSRSLWTKRLGRMRWLLSLGWPRANTTKGLPATGIPRSHPVKPTESSTGLPVFPCDIFPGWPFCGLGWAGRPPSLYRGQQADLQDWPGLPHGEWQNDQEQCLYWLHPKASALWVALPTVAKWPMTLLCSKSVW